MSRVRANAETAEVLRRLSTLETKLRRRTAALALVIGAVPVGAVLLSSTVARSGPGDLGESPACEGLSQLYCFASGQPARATEVNHNFRQIAEGVSQKVGPLEEAGVSTDWIRGESEVRLMLPGGDPLEGLPSGTVAWMNAERFNVHNDFAVGSTSGETFQEAFLVTREGAVTVNGTLRVNGCPSGWTDAGGFCYSAVQPAANSYEAQGACTGMGADTCSAGQYSAFATTVTIAECGGNCWTRHPASGSWIAWNIGHVAVEVDSTLIYGYHCCTSKGVQ